MLRNCYICKTQKDISEFPNDKSKSGGKSYRCKICVQSLEKERRRKLKETDPEKYAEMIGRWRLPQKKRRFAVLMRDSFTCQYCGRKPPEVILEVDHKNPKSRGGADRLNNYITACRDCNVGKSDILLS